MAVITCMQVISKVFSGMSSSSYGDRYLQSYYQVQYILIIRDTRVPRIEYIFYCLSCYIMHTILSLISHIYILYCFLLVRYALIFIWFPQHLTSFNLFSYLGSDIWVCLIQILEPWPQHPRRKTNILRIPTSRSKSSSSSPHSV